MSRRSASVPLTTDGGREILNGKLDWLYQEEIYGRDRFRGYWWSPDSARIAFLQLDERPVPEYTVVDHIPYRPLLEVTDYPKAGDPNPLVKLGISSVSGGAPVWTDVSTSATSEYLIVDVDWAPDSQRVVYQIQDREQTWLDLNLADVENGRSRKLLRETTKAWVNNNGDPVWLKDGSFLWFSERTGFKHLYRFAADGTVIQPVTNGRWDVRTLYGVNQDARRALFRGHRAKPHRNRHLPHQSRWHGPHAALTDRRHASRDLQSQFHALRRRVEQRDHAAAGAPPSQHRR